MAKFVIQVVEGVGKGDKRILTPGGRILLGRKPDCDLVIKGDDKVSGAHAEVRFEGGHLTLSDLGSTNGTRVEGKKITEIPISHGDRFTLGRTTIELYDPELGSPSEDMGLTIGADLLARSSRRSPLALLLLLFLVLGGLTAWWFLGRGTSREGGGTQEHPVVRIRGNLLGYASAHLEAGGLSAAEAGWWPLGRGGSFRIASSGRTGAASLQTHLGGEVEESPAPVFAVAVTGKARDLGLHRRFEARAWFRTQGRVRVGLRLLFFNRRPESPGGKREEEEGPPRFERRPDLVVGTRLSEIPGGDFQALETEALAPPGTRQVALALVAVLARGVRDEAEVFVDDVSLLGFGDSGDAGLELTFGEMGDRTVVVPDRAHGSLRIDSHPEEVLTSLSMLPPQGVDPSMEAFAEALPLPLNEFFDGLSLERTDRGFRLKGKGLGEGRARILLDVPEEGAKDQGYFVFHPQEGLPYEGGRGYERFSGKAQVPAAEAVYWRGENRRVVLRLPGPTDLEVLRTRSGEDAEGLRFLLPVDLGKGLLLDFELDLRDQILLSLNHFRQARNAEEGGDLAKALDAYGRILALHPFDDRSVSEASLRRTRLLAGARDGFRALQKKFEEARQFGYLGLLREVLDSCDALEGVYGHHPEIVSRLQDFRMTVQGELQVIEKALHEKKAMNLVGLLDALDQDEKKALSAHVRNYVEKRFPGTEAVKGLQGGGKPVEEAGERKEGVEEEAREK